MDCYHNYNFSTCKCSSNTAHYMGVCRKRRQPPYMETYVE